MGVWRKIWGSAAPKSEAEHKTERDTINAPLPTQQESERRAGPLLAAMEQNYWEGVPQVQRKAFTSYAERGFGSSGLATQGVQQALADYAAQHEAERQGAISKAYQDLTAERNARSQAMSIKVYGK